MSNIYPGMVSHGTNNKGEKITNDEVTDFRNISKIKNVDHLFDGSRIRNSKHKL